MTDIKSCFSKLSFSPSRMLTKMILVICLFILSSCQYPGPANIRAKMPAEPVHVKYTNSMSKIFLTVNSAADDMAQGLVCGASPHAMGSCKRAVPPVLVTSFVNLNNMKKTSTFGRVFSELLMTQLQTRGISVTEMRQGNVIDIKQGGGEFILTRNTRNIAKTYSANSILAGTYTITRESIILNGRLINLETNDIVSSWTNRVSRTKEVNSLFTDQNTSAVPVYERAPLR